MHDISGNLHSKRLSYRWWSWGFIADLLSLFKYTPLLFHLFGEAPRRTNGYNDSCYRPYIVYYFTAQSSWSHFLAWSQQADTLATSNSITYLISTSLHLRFFLSLRLIGTFIDRFPVTAHKCARGQPEAFLLLVKWSLKKKECLITVSLVMYFLILIFLEGRRFTAIRHFSSLVIGNKSRSITREITPTYTLGNVCWMMYD